MSFSLAGIFAGAIALWRRERTLLLPVAGVFFFLPMLALAFLLAGADLAVEGTPEKFREALMAFYQANLLAIVAVNLLVEFGTFAVLNLYLQGNGRTLGEVLGLTLRRFLPFLAINIVAGLLFGMGMSLLVLPGLFAFARTWLAAPSLAAAPENGPLAALRQGWRLTGGFGWIVLLSATIMTVAIALLMLVLATGVLGSVAAWLGGGQALAAIAYLLTALIGAFAWTALALVRVAAYRLGAAKQGM